MIDNSKRDPSTSLPEWLASTARRVEEQRALVQTLRPGSGAHRTAVELLLLFQDSLHVLTESAEQLAELKRRRRPR